MYDSEISTLGITWQAPRGEGERARGKGLTILVVVLLFAIQDRLFRLVVHSVEGPLLSKPPSKRKMAGVIFQGV